MTDTETYLTYFVVFQQAMLFLLIGLQQSLNNTVKDTLKLMLERSK